MMDEQEGTTMSSDDSDAGADREVRGVDLARQALAQAREAARAAGKAVGQGRSAPVRRTTRQGSGRRGWSGAGADERDPQTLGMLANRLARTRGWGDKVAQATVLGQWGDVVGPEIADHSQPVTLTNGVLAITAESTAWATQLRLLQGQILAKIAAAVGNGVVTSVRVSGPVAPSWRKGERHISGRGPRDTYG